MIGEYKRIIDVIENLTGIKINIDKTYLLKNRLSELMEKYSLKSYDQVADVLEEGKKNNIIDEVIDKISTHETKFFRDESIYDALIMEIIPEWANRVNITADNLFGNKMHIVEYGKHTIISTGDMPNISNQRLDIWSAASSSGQEAYSISMIIKEKLPWISPYLNILATDISQGIINKAAEGIFTNFEISRGVPDYYKDKYFKYINNNNYRIDSDIKSSISFIQHNLINENCPGMFDIVFCRNVLIYFSEDIRRQLLIKIFNSLKPNGVLVLGSSESVSGYIEGFRIREFGLARYYELKR